MKIKTILIVFLSGFFVSVGCNSFSGGSFIKTGKNEYKQNKETVCTFDVLEDIPGQEYEVIGTIKDIHRGILPVTTISQFRKAVSPIVCENGGDAVIAIRSKGIIYFNELYTDGIVIKYKNADSNKY